jgi:hypothetical protein
MGTGFFGISTVLLLPQPPLARNAATAKPTASRHRLIMVPSIATPLAELGVGCSEIHFSRASRFPLARSFDREK